MAVTHLVDDDDRLEGAEERALVVVDLLGGPRRHPVLRCARGHHTVGVPAHETAVPEAPQAGDRLVGERPGGDIATEDDHIGLMLLELGENCLERGQVSVDVVERCG